MILHHILKFSDISAGVTCETLGYTAMSDIKSQEKCILIINLFLSGDLSRM